MKQYQTLALKELLAQRLTSVLILLAIILSTMMTAVIGQSLGVLSAMRQQQAIAIGGNRHAGFVQMDREQLETLKGDPRLSFVGSYVVLGSVQLDNTLILGLSEFQEDVGTAYPAISAVKKGRLPEAPMEVALPEDVLGYLRFSGELGIPYPSPCPRPCATGYSPSPMTSLRLSPWWVLPRATTSTTQRESSTAS